MFYPQGLSMDTKGQLCIFYFTHHGKLYAYSFTEISILCLRFWEYAFVSLLYQAYQVRDFFSWSVCRPWAHAWF